MKCPHCKCEMMPWAHVRIRACVECGALWESENDVLFVPRRTRPAVPVELPDAEGWWWFWSLPDDEWRCARVFYHGERQVSYVFAFSNSGAVCQPGRYVRAEPPIVASPPEPSPKEDAEWLRQYVSGVFIAPHTKARAERIAARLERLKEE